MGSGASIGSRSGSRLGGGSDRSPALGEAFFDELAEAVELSVEEFVVILTAKASVSLLCESSYLQGATR
jgi:hypothetical protein